MAAQTKIGRRKGVIPLVRRRMTVARMFSALRMEEKLERETPRKNICIPSGARTESGGYPVQPVSNPPRAILESRMIPAGTAIQKEKAFKRGKAISLAPISSGTR